MRGRLSAAQRALNDYIREGRLSANRSQPIGAGSYGVVFESDVPGRVIKQNHPGGYATPESMTKEADLQDVGAQLGISPRVHQVETYPEGTARVEMDDVRLNYEPVRGEVFPTDPMINVRTAQQLGELALKGVRLEDRRAANVMQHKMTGRPLQLDYGIADRMSSDQQAAHLAEVTAEGFEAAGIGDMGSILRATVMDYLEGGQVTEAMDVAKQGFSRLQKIKRIDNIKTGYKRAVEQQEVEKAVDKLEQIVAQEDDTMARILGY